VRYLTLNEVLELHGQIILNGFEIRAPVEEQEQIVLKVASGELERDKFTAWLNAYIIQRT